MGGWVRKKRRPPVLLSALLSSVLKSDITDTRDTIDIIDTRDTIDVFHPAPSGVVGIFDAFDIRD